MARTTLTLLAVTGALLVSPAAEARRERHGPERGMDSLNQPVVRRTDYVMDLTDASGGVPAAEKARLRSWFDSLGVGYGDSVFVEEAYGSGPGTADVATVAAEYGLLLSEGAPVTAGSVQPGIVRVVVSRSTASVPGCPNGGTFSGPSTVSTNYGCAVNSNLAAMVANPSDLVLGQAGSGTGDAATASKAIRVYREAPPTGTKGLTTITSGGSKQ